MIIVDITLTDETGEVYKKTVNVKRQSRLGIVVDNSAYDIPYGAPIDSRLTVSDDRWDIYDKLFPDYEWPDS